MQNKRKIRISSIDFLRGIVMILMALDHVRMYFGAGTWYTEPTDLSTTTPLLFFTRWITHFCAPAFVFLSGTSAYLSGMKKQSINQTSRFLFTRGLWLIFLELLVVNLAWTFDITYSFKILQVIWAIGVGMVVLSALVYLPEKIILSIGLIIGLCHNLLDEISVNGDKFTDLLWYSLHQNKFLVLSSGNVINFVYPVLPWIGLMAVGYVFGSIYKSDFDSAKRKRVLLQIGVSSIVLFFILRGFKLYGESNLWKEQSTVIYSVLSFLKTTKYPPSLQFLLMTVGPTFIVLAFSDGIQNRFSKPIIILGKVPLFFYIIHLYFIHLLATVYLVYEGQSWNAYVISAREIMSGRLGGFGLDLVWVYIIWVLVILVLYPMCRWYQGYKENHPEKRWLGYL